MTCPFGHDEVGARPTPHHPFMAAKKKYPPLKPLPGRSWSELTKAEQNAEYVRALHAYAYEGGPNPEVRSAYFRLRAAK